MFRRIRPILIAALLMLLPLAASAQSTAVASTGAAATPALPMINFDTSRPRPDIDYVVLPSPQPTYGKGRIEVAEVFSYACIHCAQFQPTVDAWLKKLPKDVRYEYVPAAFGTVWENFARAFFAARILGVQERTHDAVFKAIHFEHTVKSPSPEDIADWYSSRGADRGKFLATMSSPQVDAMVDAARQFAARTGVEFTPTIIVAGKYRVLVTADRGFDGMLATVDYLLGLEHAQAGKPVAKKH